VVAVDIRLLTPLSRVSLAMGIPWSLRVGQWIVSQNRYHPDDWDMGEYV
jgi:hypothetical protein